MVQDYTNKLMDSLTYFEPESSEVTFEEFKNKLSAEQNQFLDSFVIKQRVIFTLADLMGQGGVLVECTEDVIKIASKFKVHPNELERMRTSWKYKNNNGTHCFVIYKDMLRENGLIHEDNGIRWIYNPILLNNPHIFDFKEEHFKMNVGAFTEGKDLWFNRKIAQSLVALDSVVNDQWNPFQEEKEPLGQYAITIIILK